MESFRKFFRQLNIKKFRKTKPSKNSSCPINKYERRGSFAGANNASVLETVLEEEECTPLEINGSAENTDIKTKSSVTNSLKKVEANLLKGEQLDIFPGTQTILPSISEENCQQWNPQDEAFLKEQRQILEEEFGNDSGFKSAEDIGSNAGYKRCGVELDRSPTFYDRLSTPFEFPDLPPMTSSARSSMDSTTSKQFNRIRLSLKMGSCNRIDNLECNTLFQSDGIINENERQLSPEMISMARRTSIDGYDEITENCDFYEEVLPTSLSAAITARRKEILVILADCKVITIEDAYIIMNNPKRYKINEKRDSHTSNTNCKTLAIENFLWLPDEFDRCFVDYINFKCVDTTSFKNLLLSPVPVAVNDAEAFAKVMSPEAKVQDLIVDGRTVGMYYSFCLNRAVFSGSTQHCPSCRVCVDWRYWHCDSCDKCSYGLSYGKCEHCSYSPKHISNNSYDSSRTALLVRACDSFETYNEFERLVHPSMESSVNNISELGDSKSHGDCYCGNPSCENLYCNIIQESCLNGPFIEDVIQDVYRSRDTSFVIGNRSSRSRTSESSGKSVSLCFSENIQYHSTPTLEMSSICKYSERSIWHPSRDSFMLSYSI